jgi:endonuclease G
MKPFDSNRMKLSAERYVTKAKRVEPFEVLIDEPATGAPIPEQREDSQARRRLAFLSDTVAQQRAALAIREAESRGVSVDPTATLATLARERIIGSSDLMNMQYLELAIAIARAVCRVRVGNGAGTGVLVGPRILMTNHHVIGSEAEAQFAEAQFDYQENQSGELLAVQSYRFDPSVFWVTDPELDFTLIGLTPVSTHGKALSGYPWLRLIRHLGKVADGDPINIIQHPHGGLKQIALRNNKIIRIPDGKQDFLYYTTDTEPGSSGSPCLNDQWELVALHHSGVPRTKDGAILKRDGSPWIEGQDDPMLIEWVANEGARVSAIVDALKSKDLRGEHDALRARMLEEEPPNPVELARLSGSPAPALPGDRSVPTVPLSSGTVSMTIPLTISVSLGGVSVGSTESVPSPLAQPLTVTDLQLETANIDPDWTNRKGYDENFLGIKIPLPTLSTEMKAQTVVVPEEYRIRGDKYVLDYHHYSLAMHKERGFAWYSAAIVDGDRRFQFNRGKDKWFIDPRIDDVNAPEFQCGEELYATANTDRGHLTRYLDVAWGETKDEAMNATYDTFHFTNCCLQLSGFNQSKSRWQGIEQFLLEKKARKEKRRIVVITGPVFAETDPMYRNEHMDYYVPVPMRFWKVCGLIRDDGTLSGTAFVLGQDDIARLPGFEEAFDVIAAQVSIADVERMTGMKFPEMRDHDHFAEGGTPGTLEIDRGGAGKSRFKPIRTFEDIVV